MISLLSIFKNFKKKNKIKPKIFLFARKQKKTRFEVNEIFFAFKIKVIKMKIIFYYTSDKNILSTKTEEHSLLAKAFLENIYIF